MGGLNTIGHAISNDKVNLDAGCKSLLGCTPVAAFIAKNCIPEFHDMALDKIQEFIVYKKAKSEMTPEELAEIQNPTSLQSKLAVILLKTCLIN